MWHGKRVVTIFGSSRPRPGEAAYALAERVGEAVARAGWVVCNGGYSGTMEAGARGAQAAGGTTLGITFRGGHGVPNRYLSHREEASDLFTRLKRLIEVGDGYLVLPGGSGTLVELSLVLELLRKRLMTVKPVVLMGRSWHPAVTLASRERPERTVSVHAVRSPAAAVQQLARAWNQ